MVLPFYAVEDIAVRVTIAARAADLVYIRPAKAQIKGIRLVVDFEGVGKGVVRAAADRAVFTPDSAADTSGKNCQH